MGKMFDDGGDEGRGNQSEDSEASGGKALVVSWLGGRGASKTLYSTRLPLTALLRKPNADEPVKV